MKQNVNETKCDKRYFHKNIHKLELLPRSVVTHWDTALITTAI